MRYALSFFILNTLQPNVKGKNVREIKHASSEKLFSCIFTAESLSQEV